MRSGARACAETLRDAGIRTIFGIPGQRILPLVDELENGCGVNVVLTRHEQGAAFMADAYARVAGLGCCFATSGPGATNLLTGAAAAYMDSVPVLAITAQAETTEFGRYGIQEGTGLGRTPDISAMFAATCKESLRPMHVDELAPSLRQALEIAAAGRPGPVHVDIPSDLLLHEETRADEVPDVASNGKPPIAPALSSEAIERVEAAIAGASRPLLLAGNGVIHSKSGEELMRFAEGADIPVAGTFLAKSVLDERHPLVLGPVGIYGRPEANLALHHEADLVVALGVSFNYMTTTGWTSRLDGERLVRVDIDTRELDNNYEAGLTVHADVGELIRALAGRARVNGGKGQARAAELREAAVAAAVDEPDPAAPAIHPVTLCRAIGAKLDDTMVVIADVGQNAYWVERHLTTRGHGRFLINGGLGSMGHGVAGAVGVAIARRDEGQPGRVLAVCGDGGFMMGGLELSVAAQRGADISWVIFNNQTLGTQRAWFRREDHLPAAVDLPPVDYVELARSLGVRGHRVESSADLDGALDEAFSAAGPSVVEVMIDPEPTPSPYQP